MVASSFGTQPDTSVGRSRTDASPGYGAPAIPRDELSRRVLRRCQHLRPVAHTEAPLVDPRSPRCPAGDPAVVGPDHQGLASIGPQTFQPADDLVARPPIQVARGLVG